MLQGANGLKGAQMIDKFKAKCSEGGKKGGGKFKAKCSEGGKKGGKKGGKASVKSRAAFAAAKGIKGSEGQQGMAAALAGGFQVRGVKLHAVPGAVLIMHRLCAQTCMRTARA